MSYEVEPLEDETPARFLTDDDKTLTDRIWFMYARACGMSTEDDEEERMPKFDESELTPRQEKLIDAIREHHRKGGGPPMYRDLYAALGDGFTSDAARGVAVGNALKPLNGKLVDISRPRRGVFMLDGTTPGPDEDGEAQPAARRRVARDDKPTTRTLPKPARTNGDAFAPLRELRDEFRAKADQLDATLAMLGAS